MSKRYLVYGLCLESELDLPDLSPAPEDRPTDVHIRFRPLPAPEGPGLQMRGTEAFLRIRDVAYFRLRPAEIAVDPAPAARETDLRAYLLGSALGALCHQRGLLPLHASAILGADGAAAFVGPSGVGKSTLVAHLARSGHDVLCDDICAIAFDDAGRPMASPGPPLIKLREDAFAWLGGAEVAGAATFDGEKYSQPTARTVGPQPLRRVYLLQDGAPARAPRISRLRGLQAAQALTTNLYRGQFVAPLGVSRRSFDLTVALARCAAVFSLTRPRGFDAFAGVAAALEAHLSDATAVPDGAEAAS